MGFNGHMGIDYAWPKPGQLIPIYAAHDGVIMQAGLETGWGNHIRIQFGNEFQTNYAHLSEIYVKKWETVKAMQKIGMMGNTGTWTGPHLHFGLRPVAFDYNNGYKWYTDPTASVVDWEIAQDYWSTIPHWFERYDDKNPITGEEARKLIDMALEKVIKKYFGSSS